jgi:hypothetical protein
MHSKIGFRVKLKINSDANIKDLTQIFQNYYNNFEILELKLNKNLVKYKQLKNIIEICENECNGEISLHLPSDYIYKKLSFDDYNDLNKTLNSINFNKDARLITHLPSNINMDELVKYIKKVNCTLPDNTTLLLENPDECGNTVEYIKKMNELFYKLLQLENNRTYLCMDFGHLFYSALKQGINFEKIFNILENCSSVIESIREIHMHDFNFDKDHIQLGLGLIELKNILNFIRNKNINVPIIIEVTLNNIFVDGKKQIEIIKQNYKELL